MAHVSPSDLLDKFMLRMPDGVRQQIAEIARREHRTMTGQINHWVQAGLDAAQARNEAGVDRTK